MGDPRLQWLFLDLNSYFASVEQELRPELRDRPMAVVPLVADDGSLVGVWDVDSPSLNRFDAQDATGMEALCTLFMALAWKGSSSRIGPR